MYHGHIAAFAGLVLFFLGLINGMILNKCRNPRVGLSAHLTAVQCGTFLVAIDALWPHFDLGAWSDPIAIILSGGAFLLWAGILAGAIFERVVSFPIATGDSPVQRMHPLVAGSLGLGSLGLVVATAILILRM